MNPPKSPPKHRVRWMNWYRGKAAERSKRGLTHHGTPRIYKMKSKPGYEKLADVINEIVELLHDCYPTLPFSLQTRSNIVGRKLASIKRHSPRKKVRVV